MFQRTLEKKLKNYASDYPGLQRHFPLGGVIAVDVSFCFSERSVFEIRETEILLLDFPSGPIIN